MEDIKNNKAKWKNVLQQFKIHFIPILNPEGYLISTSAIRKLIPRDMTTEEAEAICRKYYNVYKQDDSVDSKEKQHLQMFKDVDTKCIPEQYMEIRMAVEEILEKFPDLPRECLHIWSSNARGIDIQANCEYNPKIAKIMNNEDIYMNAKRHNIFNISHPGPINCPFNVEDGFKIEVETKAIASLLDRLNEKGTLFAYLNFHSTGGLIFQRPSIPPEQFDISNDELLKRKVVNFLFATAYSDKTYKDRRINEKGEDKKKISKYKIITAEDNATSSNDIFRLKYPKDLLIELSGMGGNPIGPYGDINGNYTNAMNSNLDAVKYILKIATVLQAIAEESYKVINQIGRNVQYEQLTSIEKLIYKEFSSAEKKISREGAEVGR